MMPRVNNQATKGAFDVFLFPTQIPRLFFSEEDSDEEEDDTAELLRELEKIKRERAEEKERQERERKASADQAREVEIATANPLLNLAAALGQSPGINTTAPGTFAVKRRWDDGKHLSFLQILAPTNVLQI